MESQLIDIHNHTLYGVDDGADSLEISLKMLERAKRDGISAIILTPHYRHGMFPYDADVICNNLRILREKSASIGVRLYLGCEFHVNSKIVQYLKSKRCIGLADTKYVLAEYSYTTEYQSIYSSVSELLANGFVPVIAHAERYKCMLDDIDRAQELRRMGALIQLNADSLLGLLGRSVKKYCKKMLKEERADIVASDAHGIDERQNNLRKAYDYIAKKYSQGYADLLMHDNPMQILNAVKKEK